MYEAFCVLQLPISYSVSSIMVTITRYVFINTFQTEHFSAVKFHMGYKDMSFLAIPKSAKFETNKQTNKQTVEKKIRLGSFNLSSSPQYFVHRLPYSFGIIDSRVFSHFPIFPVNSTKSSVALKLHLEAVGQDGPAVGLWCGSFNPYMDRYWVSDSASSSHPLFKWAIYNPVHREIYLVATGS